MHDLLLHLWHVVHAVARVYFLLRVCVCVCTCACMYVRACVRVCVTSVTQSARTNANRFLLHTFSDEHNGSAAIAAGDAVETKTACEENDARGECRSPFVAAGLPSSALATSALATSAPWLSSRSCAAAAVFIAGLRCKNRRDESRRVAAK